MISKKSLQRFLIVFVLYVIFVMVRDWYKYSHKFASLNQQGKKQEHKKSLDYIQKHADKLKLNPDEKQQIKTISNHLEKHGFLQKEHENILNTFVKKIKTNLNQPYVDESDSTKEVFNINENLFTYDQASGVCRKFNSELATQGQVKEAHEKGANWCNYGWSKDQLALYPIQQSYYDQLQLDPSKRDNCGKPGVNGGYFDNKNIRFGVNCYGVKPKPDPSMILYDEIQKEVVIDHNKLNVKPFNSTKWSETSKRQSEYNIIPDVNVRAVIKDNKIQKPVYQEQMVGYVNVPYGPI